MADLIFDIPTLIRKPQCHPPDPAARRHRSRGTPVGVGIGFNPPRYLRAGDIMRVEISGLGVLDNTVV
ncbi:MAG: fumarylacetoacetate hydrolase family protein [Burkholderiaceae bacterium]